jgi:hypothetical protein
MYKPYLVLALGLSLLTALQSCSKDHDKPIDTNPPSSWGDLLESIEWDNGSKETFAYNADSTLKQIAYSFGNSAHSYEFSWAGKRMVEMHDNISLYKNTYTYNGNKVFQMTNTPKNDPATSSYKMEYTYNAIGKVDKLKYFVINEAGTELRAGTSYQYNAAGDLIKSITSTGNTTITQSIDGYSTEAAFNPWAFIDFTLLENYMIFNYPVLSSMKGYPLKITRTVQTANDPPFVDIITTNTCEISNKRINKLKIEIKDPAMPGYNVTYTGRFIYK